MLPVTNPHEPCKHDSTCYYHLMLSQLGTARVKSDPIRPPRNDQKMAGVRSPGRGRRETERSLIILKTRCQTNTYYKQHLLLANWASPARAPLLMLAGRGISSTQREPCKQDGDSSAPQPRRVLLGTGGGGEVDVSKRAAVLLNDLHRLAIASVAVASAIVVAAAAVVNRRIDLCRRRICLSRRRG